MPPLPSHVPLSHSGVHAHRDRLKNGREEPWPPGHSGHLLDEALPLPLFRASPCQCDTLQGASPSLDVGSAEAGL